MADDKSGLGDLFDRALGALDGRPDVMHTAPATLRTISPVLGAAQTFIVQTWRERETKERGGVETSRGRDTIFIEYIDASDHYRIVIPASVADTIARQRDALTAKTRSRVAKAQAADRKARGIKPGFMGANRETGTKRKARKRKGATAP